MTWLFISAFVLVVMAASAGFWWRRRQVKNPAFELQVTNRQVLQSEVPEGASESLPEPKGNLIVALYIRAQHDQIFQGESLLTIFQQIGLQFGDMDIFHHYGPAQDATENPVFSLANMHEPGKFDLASMKEFQTHGLVTFMQLPGSLSGRVAFELMLNAAQRLAESLDGIIEDEQRQPIDADALEYIRDSINEFETSSG
ncbi:MAG: cell division protein ZipA [Pseudomonadota bacterium]